MINNKEFVNRLQKIIEFHEESASGFAEKIGVQRSSISHILSGRNKPSLDFVMKVLQAYPDVSLYWLLNGKGTFPSTSPIQETTQPTLDIKNSKEILKETKTIERIVIFFNDGSFKSYQN